MEDLKILLKNKKIKKSKSNRPINYKWEIAQEFASKTGLQTPFVLRLFSEFGQDKVLALKSWLADLDSDPKRLPGLVVWKLQKKEPIDKVGQRCTI